MGGFNVKDALLKGTQALPNGSAAATLGGAIQLGLTSKSDFLAECELVLTGPALAVGELANAATITYDIVTADNSALTTNPVELGKGVLVQTGAGGVGAALATKRFALPTNVKDWVGLRATNSGAGDASGKSATLEVAL